MPSHISPRRAGTKCTHTHTHRKHTSWKKIPLHILKEMQSLDLSQKAISFSTNKLSKRIHLKIQYCEDLRKRVPFKIG